MRSRNINKESLNGVYTALITPMIGNGYRNVIDWDKMKLLVESQVNAGVNGFVINGTTGQSPVFDWDTQMQVANTISSYINENVQTIYGATSNNTREVIKYVNMLEENDSPVTILSATGYYNKPGQQGMIKHYRTIADNMAGNLILYEVPGRTNCRLDKTSLEELAKSSNIVGIKDATGDLERVELIKDLGFQYLSGEDNIFAHTLNLGGDGIISASANLAPKMFCDIYNSNSTQERLKIQENLNTLVSKIFSASNPIPLHYAFRTDIELPLSIDDMSGYDKWYLNMLIDFMGEEKLGIDISKFRK